jgi:hypothetical protein
MLRKHVIKNAKNGGVKCILSQQIGFKLFLFHKLLIFNRLINK